MVSEARGKILVVDDNRVNRLKISMGVQQQGHDVVLGKLFATSLPVFYSFDARFCRVHRPRADSSLVCLRRRPRHLVRVFRFGRCPGSGLACLSLVCDWVSDGLRLLPVGHPQIEPGFASGRGATIRAPALTCIELAADQGQSRARFERRSLAVLGSLTPGQYFVKYTWVNGGESFASPEAGFKVTAAQVKEIAKRKLNDLNARDEEHATRIVAGTARSMGIAVEGL